MMVKLFSIKEEFTNKIYSKKKMLELRRQNVSISVNEVCLIYTTNPVKKITGYFIVKNKLRLPIEELWQMTKEDSGVDKETFFNYFRNCVMGTAIVFKKVVKLKNGVCLYEIKRRKKGFVPPQSYFSIDINFLRIISEGLSEPPKELKNLIISP